MLNPSVIFQPTENNLNEIKDWLIVENEEKKSFKGFYCNWADIKYHYQRNELAVIIFSGKLIGFITWLFSKRVASIQITEIKPGFRKKGYGRFLLETVINKFKQRGIKVVHLHCQPKTSERVWKKLGFEQYPSLPCFDDFNNAEKGRHLYRIVVPYAKPSNNFNSSELINLWADEPFKIDNLPPKWIWPLAFEKGTKKLLEPIIVPVNINWKMSLTRNGELIKSQKIKHFAKEDIYSDGFLIIEELPLV